MASTLCRDWRIRRIVFFVDNKGVILRTMNPVSPKRKPGQSLFNLIDEALSALPPAAEVFMAWCPGQRDILGNEVADELAREAVLHPTSSVFKIKSNLHKTAQMSLADLFTKCAKPSSLSFAAASILIRDRSANHFRDSSSKMSGGPEDSILAGSPGAFLQDDLAIRDFRLFDLQGVNEKRLVDFCGEALLLGLCPMVI
ncbi:hypothetical protein PGT21_010974 [Puccinia graminis f. sp. tritici]|uniref:RNase H type-1 domain-containing protein n=1 Tax=Puccinia graminis f. sp. tritici TaxID=56615 RepID=A0A5B0P924_PUCGR|nr:hypothetical protein PGT21_010974 [Puccinia graminis f. sp. tritici]KAA1134082.1 hypothetical protein PGTUg99_024633 [Puccinia graminis f. sp. tritici]